MADDTRQASTSVASQNGGFMCADLINLIVISILYGIGNDKECGIPVDNLLLTYIIIKASCVVIRCCLCGLTIGAPAVGMITTLGCVLIWVVGMIVYYIFALVYFFDGDNDCLDEATVHWVGLLLIVIEAFSMFLIFILVCCILACSIPVIIALATADAADKD